MTPGERVLSFTQDELLPRAVDQVFDGNVIISRMIGNAKKWIGETMKRPIRYQGTGQGGSFAGMGNFSTAATTTTARLAYDLRAYEHPVVVPGLDRLLNEGPAQVVDLMQFKLDEATQEVEDQIGDLAYDDGTGGTPANSDFLGLGAFVDDGTDVTTIGGLSRDDYSVLNAVRTASGGNVDLAKMATLVSDVSAGSVSRSRPTMFTSDDTVWNLIETLITPTLNANYQTIDYSYVTRSSKAPMKSAELKGAAGFASIIYKGIPIVADQKATAETLFAMNENFMDWHGKFDPRMSKVNLGTSTMDSVYADAPSVNHGFNFSGWLTPTGSYGDIAHIYLFGNHVNWQPRRFGKLIDIAGA